jgi:hypothetical protein
MKHSIAQSFKPNLHLTCSRLASNRMCYTQIYAKEYLVQPDLSDKTSRSDLIEPHQLQSVLSSVSPTSTEAIFPSNSVWSGPM